MFERIIMEKIICIILLVLYGIVILLMCYIAIFSKEKKPKTKELKWQQLIEYM